MKHRTALLAALAAVLALFVYSPNAVAADESSCVTASEFSHLRPGLVPAQVDQRWGTRGYLWRSGPRRIHVRYEACSHPDSSGGYAVVFSTRTTLWVSKGRWVAQPVQSPPPLPCSQTPAVLTSGCRVVRP